MKEKPTYEELAAENQRLRYVISQLCKQLKGFKSEKKKPIPEDPNQPGLFDDELQEALDEKALEVQKTAEEINAEAEARRKKKQRQTSNRPAHYRVSGLEERITNLLPEGVNPEQCDVIGMDVVNVLHYVPARVYMEVIKRPILRHKEDKDAPEPRIFQAPSPIPVIPGNHVGADMLSQIMVNKFQYHLPEYRQVKQFADLGVRLPTSTINDWVHATGAKLEPLYQALRAEILSGDYLQVDEVPWRIADRKGTTRKGYAWQFFDARPRSIGLYFAYHKGSRAGTVPRAELLRFKGAIQTDGYSVYDYFETQDDVTLLGCMAHVRRKFVDAQASHPDLAAKAIEWISPLYELEANLRDREATPEQIAAERQAKALPIMDSMLAWMELSLGHCTPSDPMGRAIDYAMKMWPRLRRYALDGRYLIDNNGVERGQRPSVLGRKNYLFSKTDSGAFDNAIFYSLIQSCVTVGVNPKEWLEHALSTLRDDMSEAALKELLPHNYKKSCH